LLISVSALLTSAEKLSAQTGADWTWMEDNYSHVLNDLTPANLASVKASYRWGNNRVGIEYAFWIGNDFGDAPYPLRSYLSAYVAMADSASIYNQMLDMHLRNHQEDAQSLEEKIKVKRWSFTEMSCPAVKSQFEKLQGISFAVPKFSDVIVVDACSS